MALTTWTATNGNGDFNTAADWTNGVPGPGDTGFIDGSSTTPLIVTFGLTDTSETVGALSLFDSTLVIHGGTAAGTGTLTIGTFTTSDDTLASPLTELSVVSGRLVIQQSSTIGNYANTQIIGLTQTGGTIEFQNSESRSAISALEGEQGGVLQTGSAATLQVDYGTLLIEGNSVFAGTLAGADGTVELAGGAIYAFNATTKLNVGEVTLQGAGSLLQIEAKVTDVHLFIQGSSTTIDLSGNTLTLNQTADLLGGVIALGGTLVNAGTIDDSGMTLQDTVLFDNTATINQRAGIVIGGTATLENAKGAVYNILTDGAAVVTGSGTFDNTGTLEKTTGAFSAISSLFNNIGNTGSAGTGGDILVNSSTLDFANNDSFGGTITGTGTVELSGGGSNTLYSGISLTVGSFYVSAANGNGLLQLEVLGALTYGGVFVQDTGTTIQLQPATLNGVATLTLTNAADRVDGTFIGAGVAGKAPAALLVLDSTAAAMSDNNMVVRGGMTVEDAGRINQGGTVTIGLLSGDAPELLITSGATYDFNATSVIVGDGTIDNLGTFEQGSQVTGTSIVTTFFESGNAATVLCQNGTIEFTGSDTFGGTLAGQGTVMLSGASFTLKSGLSVSVSALDISSVAGAAQVTLLANLTYAHSFEQTAGTTLSLNSGTTTSPTLTLTGASTLDGAISGVGAADVIISKIGTASANGMVLTGSVTILDQGVIGQQGTVIIGSLPGDTAALLVAAGATYDLTVVSFMGGDGRINVANNGTSFGTFEQAASVTGLSTVATNLTSNGVVVCNGGTLEFTGGDTFANKITGAATVAFSGASFTLDPNIVVSVATLEVTSNAGAAEVFILGTLLDYAGSFVQTSNTTLSLTGTTELELTGPNDVLNGTIVGAGGPNSPSLVLWASSATGSDNGLSLTGGVTLMDEGQIGQLGTVTVGALPGDLAVLQIGTAAGSQALYDLRVQSIVNGYGNITNFGTFEQDVFVTGRSIVETHFSSTGTVLETTGTLEFTGADMFSGKIAGSGELQLSGAQSTLDASTADGGLTVTVATLDISANAGAANVTILGTLSYGGLFNEEAGTTLSLNAATLTLSTPNDLLNGVVSGTGGTPATLIWAKTATGSDAGLTMTGNATLLDYGFIGQVNTDTIGSSPGDSTQLTIESGGSYFFRGPSVLTGNGTITVDGGGAFGQGSGGVSVSVVSAQFTSDSNSVVTCNSGTIEFNATDSFAGTITGSGLIELSGAYTFAKGLVLSVGTLQIGDSAGTAQVLVESNLTYTGSLTLELGSTITLAQGAVLTLTNSGNLILGTIAGQAKSQLMIGTGQSASDDGLAVTGATTVTDAGTVGQSATVTIGANAGDTHSLLWIKKGAVYSLSNAAVINGNGSILNAGTLVKNVGTQTSTIAPALTNSQGASVTANTGTLLFNTSVHNNGLITAQSGGTIDFAGGVLAAAGSTGTIAVGSLGTAIFANAVGTTETVSFADATGHISIAEPMNFGGTISGFQGTANQSDSIDLTGISHNGATESWQGTSTGGVLTIQQTVGGQSTTVAQLHFAGNYSLSSFTFSADASGSGTIITDPPAAVQITAQNVGANAVAFSNAGGGVETAMLMPAGNGIEQVLGFRMNGLDVLDLRDVLAGAWGHPTLGDIGDYITTSCTGGDTTLSYDPTGRGHGGALATLNGVHTTMAGLLAEHALRLG